MEPRLKGNIDMEKSAPIVFELGDAAEGSIEPTAEQRERLQEAIERIDAGEFDVPVPEGWVMPVVCVDGRVPEGGQVVFGPNAAGGLMTITVADDLTAKRFASADGSITGALRNTVEVAQGLDQPVGGHGDTKNMADEHGPTCGCGACDKLNKGYAYIAAHGEILKGIVESLGGSARGHEKIVANAQARVDSQNFPAGRELFTILNDANEHTPERMPVLAGEHREALMRFNLRPDVTIDRNLLAAAYPEIDLFEVDAGSFKEAAQKTSLTIVEAEEKETGMLYFNGAIGCVLAGPRMPVLVSLPLAA